MTDCKTSGSPCALSARQTPQRAAKSSKCLQTHTPFIKPCMLCFLPTAFIVVQSNNYANTGHLLNSSVTNYSITLNGIISKGSFLPREWSLPRLHRESRELAPRGRQGGGKAPESTYSHTAAPQAVLAALSSFASLQKAALPSLLPLSSSLTKGTKSWN